LFNPKLSYFGRTYRGRQIPLKTLPEGGELFMEETDWVMFYTQTKARETKAVVEVIVNEYDVLKSVHRSRSVGYGVIPMFYDEVPEEIDLWRGSPRDVLKHMNEVGHEPPLSNSKLSFSVRKIPQKDVSWMMSIVPDNILIGSSDELPGVKGSILPVKIEQIGKILPCEMQPLYAHNVRISSMNEVEQTFA